MSKKNVIAFFIFFNGKVVKLRNVLSFQPAVEKPKHSSIAMTQVGTDHIEHAPILEDLFHHFGRVTFVKYLP